MNLELIKNENKIFMAKDTTEIKFNFIKNNVQKDLDVTCWAHKAYNLLGDLDIYSNCRLELSCFLESLSFLLGRKIDFAEDSLEVHYSSMCTEYLFVNILYNIDAPKINTEELSMKFTRCLFEASSIFLYIEEDQKGKRLDNMFQRHFPGFEYHSWKNPNSLNQNM